MLPEGEVEPLHEGGIELAAEWSQHGIDGLQRAKHHAMTDPCQPPGAYGLDNLCIKQLGPRHPARLGHGTFAWASWGLHPVSIVDLREGTCDETSFGGCVDSLFCRSSHSNRKYRSKLIKNGRKTLENVSRTPTKCRFW